MSNLGNGKKSKPIIIVKLLMCLFIFPVVLTDLFIRKILGTTSILGRGLDSLTATVVRERMLTFIAHHLAANQIQEIENDQQTKALNFFRLIYHYVCENSDVHFGKLQNYVALFGFTRTICFTSIVLLWILLIKGIVTGWSVFYSYYGIGLFCIAGVMYLNFNFNKFYRKYSVEALMAFSVIYDYKTSK